MYIQMESHRIIQSSKEQSEVQKMNVQERIRRSSILEEMKKHRDAAKRLGLQDLSTLKTAPLKTNTLRIYSMK